MTTRIKHVVIVGAGRSGLAIAYMLQTDGRYSFELVVPVEEAYRIAHAQDFSVIAISGTDQKKIKPIFDNADVVVMTGPESIATTVASLALQSNCHYIDLNENSNTTSEIAKIAQNANTSFVPRCGIAPGYITSVVADMIQKSGVNTEICAYVGVLPSQKINRLGYANLWNVDGLITEYTQPCHAILNGQKQLIPPLTKYENLTIAGQNYEAFTTSGSVDELVTKYNGKIKSLVFKTLRYQGHLDYFKFLFDDLGLKDRKNFLKNILMNGLPVVKQDEIILFITSKFQECNTPNSLTYVKHFTQIIKSKDNENPLYGNTLSRATSAHACSVIDYVCSPENSHKGLLNHESISPDLLKNSPFYEMLLTENTC